MQLLHRRTSLPTITLAEMKRAMMNKLGKRGLSREEIDDLARLIMGYFGFEDFVVDNRLSSNERDIFYMLEEEGFLTTLQDEVIVKKGKLWRIHYWILKYDAIRAFASSKDEEKKVEKFSVYGTLEDDAWRHKK
jgi:hypothetical protein